MENIIAFAVFLITCCAVISLCYMSFYKRMINKRLQSGKLDGRKFVSPLNMLISTSIVLLLAFCVGTAVVSVHTGSVVGTNQFDIVYNYNEYTPDDMNTGYLKNYSIEENVGYKRYETICEDIKFTYFINESQFDLNHPQFIIYVSYIGSRSDMMTVSQEGTFYTLNDKRLGSEGSGGTNLSDYICYIGNVSDQSKFKLDIQLFSEQGWENYILDDNEGKNKNIDPLDYAESTATLELTFRES